MTVIKLKDLLSRTLAWIWSKVGHVFGDVIYLKVRFFLIMGKSLNLKEPRTIAEKLQWLKLYNKRPEYTTQVDKYAVKEYVSNIIGNEYVIPTLGVWDNPDDIDWDVLPRRFVLKTTHGGGSNGVVICKDKKHFDRRSAVKLLKKNMLRSDWRIGMEWPYKDVTHRVIAEEFISTSSETNSLIDYKWYCFDGEPQYCQVIQGRNNQETIDFFDKEWKHQEFTGLHPYAKNAVIMPARPTKLQQQIELAKALAENKPFSRIDLYEVDGKILFGEITFFPLSGMGSFSPDYYNFKLGQMLKLPPKCDSRRNE